MLATFPLTLAIKNYTRKAAKQGNKRTDQFLMLNQLKTSQRERDGETHSRALVWNCDNISWLKAAAKMGFFFISAGFSSGPQAEVKTDSSGLYAMMWGQKW